jgi:hypothetical protein
MWAEFTEAWDAALREPPAIKFFKMNHAAKCGGEFGRFSLSERDQKLRKLAGVISQFGFTAIHCTTDLGMFDSLVKNAPRPIRDPYFVPSFIVTGGVTTELLINGHRERCEIIFDEAKHFSAYIKKAYPFIRELFIDSDESVEKVMPIEPLFRSDEVERPLQAADMLAWFFRRRAPNSDPADNQFDWLLPHLFTMPISDLSTTLTGNGWIAKFQDGYMPSLIDRVSKYYDGLLDDE